MSVNYSSIAFEPLQEVNEAVSNSLTVRLLEILATF